MFLKQFINGAVEKNYIYKHDKVYDYDIENNVV